MHRASCRIYWSHAPSDDLVGGPGFLPLQRLADCIGLAYLDPISHLCLHPKFGPWLSMRAVLVFDGVTYTGAQGPLVSLFHQGACFGLCVRRVGTETGCNFLYSLLGQGSCVESLH